MPTLNFGSLDYTHLDRTGQYDCYTLHLSASRSPDCFRMRALSKTAHGVANHELQYGLNKPEVDRLMNQHFQDQKTANFD